MGKRIVNRATIEFYEWPPGAVTLEIFDGQVLDDQDDASIAEDVRPVGAVLDQFIDWMVAEVRGGVKLETVRHDAPKEAPQRKKQVADLEAEIVNDENLWRPFVQDVGYDVMAIRLWRQGQTAAEIGRAVSKTTGTINNKICALRKLYGEKIVPLRRRK